jgi:hypothetical protein
MTTTTFSPPIPLPIPSLLKKKRVLLIDISPSKRDLRAECMRKLGMDVDCAADITEARSWWRADLYDLVLINAEKGLGHRDRFCDDILGAKPPQQLAFLVGQPEYLAALPNPDDEPWVPVNCDQGFSSDVRTALSAVLADPPQRWGILEAARRISSVRAASKARVSARRDRPAPPRDTEGRPSKRIAASTTLDDLLREELR